jgi:O-Antigen ligase
MIYLLGLGFMLTVAAVVGVVLVEALIRRAELGAALMLGTTVLYAALVDRVPALTLPGDIKVELHDVVFALILGAAVLRLLRMRRFTALQRCAVLLGIMLLLSVVRGTLAFGIVPSVAEFRLYLAFATGALYFATFPPSDRVNDRIGRIWLATSIPMMILVCLRWMDNLAGIELGVPAEQFGADAAIRVLNGPYTFFLAHAAVITIPFWQLRDERARKLTWFGALLMLFVLLLNRRTVWLTVLVGIAVILLRNRRLRRPVALTVAGAAIVTAGILFLAGPETGREDAPFAASATNTSTLEWRVEGWSLLVASWSENPAEWFVGQPFGSGFTRSIGLSKEQSEPHNFYVTTLLRTGVVGMLALVALTGGLLRALWPNRAQGDGLLAPSVFPALLAMQLVWFITWTPGMEQGIITGLAVALAAQRIRGRAASPPARPVAEEVG